MAMSVSSTIDSIFPIQVMSTPTKQMAVEVGVPQRNRTNRMCLWKEKEREKDLKIVKAQQAQTL